MHFDRNQQKGESHVYRPCGNVFKILILHSVGRLKRSVCWVDIFPQTMKFRNLQSKICTFFSPKHNDDCQFSLASPTIPDFAHFAPSPPQKMFIILLIRKFWKKNGKIQKTRGHLKPKNRDGIYFYKSELFF